MRTAIALVLILLFRTGSAGELITVTVEGSASTKGGDYSAAKLTALARARWAAVSEAANVRSTSATLLMDLMVREDSLLERTDGVITEMEVLEEYTRNDLLVVQIRAVVAQDPARLFLSQFARNHAVAVYIPYRALDGSLSQDHELSTRLINHLADIGYDMVDLRGTDLAQSFQSLQRDIGTGDYSNIKPVLYEYLTNAAVVGTVDVRVVGRPGDYDPTGPLPMYLVDATLDYRVLVGDGQQLSRVLASGEIRARGGSAEPTKAADRAIRDLADEAIPEITRQVTERIKALSPRVTVRIDGVRDYSIDRNVRDELERIVWVHSLQTIRPGEYVVEYPENVAYLAASITQLPGFYVASYSPTSILGRYEGP